VRFATRRLGKDVIDLVDASITLGDRPLLDKVTWRLAPGERVGIVGVNGSGKSTLLRAIAGDVPLDSGRRKVGKTVALAHLTQEVRELDELAAYRVIDAVEEVGRVVMLGDREVTASQLAQRLGSPGMRQQTRVGDLSGGERRRLQILRLLMAEPNVLLLDEPTNDLDIETLTSLEDVLDGWAGTLIVVSHDRYLLERVTDRQVALLGDGRVRDLPRESTSTSPCYTANPGMPSPLARVPPRRPLRRRVADLGLALGLPLRVRRLPSSVKPARNWPASRRRCRGSPNARSGCTPTWRPRPVTTSRCSNSTAPCGPSSTNARILSSPGWRPPRSSADQLWRRGF
jgi:ABC-type Mn2+/Zn2+ transport system ATPase subunit